MSSSTSHEQALAQAKQIAAGIVGSTTSVSTSTSGSEPASMSTVTQPTPSTSKTTTKRKRWGVASTATATSTTTTAATAAPSVIPSAIPGLAEAVEKKQKLEKAEPTTKRMWVPTSATKPETHFKSYLSDRLPDMLIRLNRENGTPGDDKNSIELGGRGAATTFVPGMPLEPMHVMITGSPSFIQLAAGQVDELLGQAEKAPLEGPPPDPSTLTIPRKSDTSGSGDKYVDPYAGALTTVTKRFNGTTEATSSYRPATVAQLLAGGTGSGIPTFNPEDGPLIEENIHVPNGIVGFIIGRGGETITSLQARTGAKVQIQKEQDLQPGQTHRVITLQATKQDAIDRVREMIEKMVEERVRAAGGKMGGGTSNMGSGGSKAGLGAAPDGSVEAKVQEALDQGHKLVVAEVPDADVGMIIGKGGVTIKGIQESTNSKVQIPPSGSNVEDPSIRKISITSPTEEGALAAKAEIDRIMATKKANQGTANPAAPTGHELTIQVMIPDQDVGMCIGKQGCVINELQRRSGAKINIPTHPTPGQPFRAATVSGTQDAINHAQALIQQISREQSSMFLMPAHMQNNNNNNQRRPYGGGYQQRNHYAPQNQPQHNQMAQQHSNDPAWAAYYAALAQQQAKQEQAAAAQPPAAPQDTSKYEDYFRYEYYYGTDAARAYYGAYPAYCPPPGMSNPYGTNPNGISAAPGQTPAQSTPAAAPATERSAIHSAPNNAGMGRGRGRGVSNLPAWLVEQQRKEAGSS